MTGPAEVLEAQNQALQQQVAELQMQLAQARALVHQRAEPLTVAVLDTLATWCEMAENPRHPAQPAARSLIDRWLAVHKRMGAAAGGIAVVRDFRENGSAPG